MTKQSNQDSDDYDEWEDADDRYEYAPPRKRFRRNKIDGMIGGVCSGIGDYLNIDPVIVRVLTVISFFITGGVTFWIYIGLWALTPNDMRAPYRREYRHTRYTKRRAKRRAKSREAIISPSASYGAVKSKYRSLETRMQNLEKSVTSSEWQLRRKFKDLEN